MEVSVKNKTLYILDNVKNCEFLMCILIVDHQFNRMHPSGNACFQEGAVLAKGVMFTPFGRGISCCYPSVWVK